MALTLSKQLVNGIRKLMFKLERTAGLSKNDPDVISLKAIFRRRLHELKGTGDPEHPLAADWTRGQQRRLRRRQVPLCQSYGNQT